MLVDNRILLKLKDLGLNSYESKVWTALLSRGISTAGELSDIANVPRSRSYDVLESLEKKGFVIVKLGKPIKYIAISPQETIERVKKRIEKNANDQRTHLEELKKSSLLKELDVLHNKGIETRDPSELTGSIKGRENIYNHLEYQLKTAKESFVLVSNAKSLPLKIQALKKQIVKAHKRGVKITLALPLGQLNSTVKEKLRENSELQEFKEKNARFCVVDRSKVTFMITDDKTVHPSYELAIWLQSPYYAEGMLSWHGLGS